MQNKILRRGTQILSDFLRQKRRKEGKKQRKSEKQLSVEQTAKEKSIHLQLIKHNRKQTIL